MIDETAFKAACEALRDTLFVPGESIVDAGTRAAIEAYQAHLAEQASDELVRHIAEVIATAGKGGMPFNDLVLEDRMIVFDEARAIIAAMPAAPEGWRELIADFIHENDECEYDHHGYCQAHSLAERPCPHERAKAMLAAAPPPPTAQPEDTE